MMLNLTLIKDLMCVLIVFLIMIYAVNLAENHTEKAN